MINYLQVGSAEDKVFISPVNFSKMSVLQDKKKIRRHKSQLHLHPIYVPMFERVN